MAIPLPPLNFNNSSAADPVTSLDGSNGISAPFIIGGSGRMAANAGPEGLGSAAAAFNQVDTGQLAMIAGAVFLLMMLIGGRK